MEALLGAFLVAGGYGAALAFLQASTLSCALCRSGGVRLLLLPLATASGCPLPAQHSTWGCLKTGGPPRLRRACRHTRAMAARPRRSVMWRQSRRCWGEAGQKMRWH